jgi:hypothetical protein
MKQNTSHYSCRSRQEAKILSSQCQSNMIRDEAKMSKPSLFSNHPRHSKFNQATSGKTAKSTMLAIYVCSCSRSHPLGADRASMLPYASYHLFHTHRPEGPIHRAWARAARACHCVNFIIRLDQIVKFILVKFIRLVQICPLFRISCRQAHMSGSWVRLDLLKTRTGQDKSLPIL